MLGFYPQTSGCSCNSHSTKYQDTRTLGKKNIGREYKANFQNGLIEYRTWSTAGITKLVFLTK